jgi:hypothetical protein
VSSGVCCGAGGGGGGNGAVHGTAQAEGSAVAMC